ncbi:MAG TPA: DUF3147 family protein [Polyangiaceae bacterium]|jgi:hypothetical protein
MIPDVSFAGLKRPKAWEHALRFVFGGTIAVGAALVGKAFGPSAGGLFLAFPAILPASLTLVKQHDGRAQAVDDARGARLGALALICFAAVTLMLHRHGATLSLLAAAATWFLVAFLLWFLVYGRRRRDAAQWGVK